MKNKKKYAISEDDYQKYLDNSPSSKAQLIWADILSQISNQRLRSEARIKGFQLEDNPDIKETKVARCFLLNVPDGSSDVQAEIRKIGNDVILLKN